MFCRLFTACHNNGSASYSAGANAFLDILQVKEGAKKKKKQGLIPELTSQRDVFLTCRLQTYAGGRGKTQMTGASHFY